MLLIVYNFDGILHKAYLKYSQSLIESYFLSVDVIQTNLNNFVRYFQLFLYLLTPFGIASSFIGR